MPSDSNWEKVKNADYEQKVILGGRTFFHRCCGLAMRRIFGFIRLNGEIRRTGLGYPKVLGWYCEVCEKRKDQSLW